MASKALTRRGLSSDLRLSNVKLQTTVDSRLCAKPEIRTRTEVHSIQHRERAKSSVMRIRRIENVDRLLSPALVEGCTKR
jgi:hypothetical protein